MASRFSVPCCLKPPTREVRRNCERRSEPTTSSRATRPTKPAKGSTAQKAIPDPVQDSLPHSGSKPQTPNGPPGTQQGSHIRQATNHFRAVRQTKPPIPTKHRSKFSCLVNPLPKHFQPTSVTHLAIQRGG